MNDKQVREWARATGLPVGQRGRLPSDVVAAYMEAHPDDQWSEEDHNPRARCPGCGRAWAGLAQCHCATCHEHFSRVAHFDVHLSGCGLFGGDDLEGFMASIGLKKQFGLYGATWVSAEERPEL